MTKAFFLLSPSEKGKVLGIEDDKLCYLRPGDGETLWSTRKVGKGFHIVTAKGDKGLSYDPHVDEQIKILPKDELHTLWHANDAGEIYTKLPNGEKKYLWSMSDGVYVTADEYLAENWKMVSLEGFDMTSAVADRHASKRMPLWFWVVLMVLALGVVWVLLKNRY